MEANFYTRYANQFDEFGNLAQRGPPVPQMASRQNMFGSFAKKCLPAQICPSECLKHH